MKKILKSICFVLVVGAFFACFVGMWIVITEQQQVKAVAP